MRKSSITLKWGNSSSLQQQAKERRTGTSHSIPRQGAKHPSSLNNWASCQGIATVLLGRSGTSIPALFNRNNIKEISKTLQFHFHEATASTGIISSSPSSFCSWLMFSQTSSGPYFLTFRHVQGRFFSKSSTTSEVKTAN